MPTMKTIVHYTATGKGVSPKSEALMRDPAFVAAETEHLNRVAKEAAAVAGESTDFTITGSIHAVSHHA